MTLLRYSHHHHGANPVPRATAGKAFVKTTVGAKMSWSSHNRSLTTTTTTTTTTTPSPADNNNNNKNTTNNYHWSRPQQASNYPPTKPYARGPQPRHHGNTWRRPTSHQDSQPTEQHSIQVPKAEASLSLLFSNKVNENSSSDNDSIVQNVTKQTTSTAERPNSPNSIAVEPKDIARHEEEEEEEEEASLSASSSNSSSFQPPEKMKKRGAHKLVRQDRLEHVHVHNELDATSQLHSERAASLRKIGPNKLVYSNHPVKDPPTAAAAHNTVATAKQKLIYSSQQRRLPPRPHSRAPAAKRVKLSEAPSGGVADSSSSSTSFLSAGNVKGEKQMTDFAYRESSTVSSHGNRTLSQGHATSLPSGRRNMGLVRVPHDESKTPICPTFMQGLVCTNEACKKRHDVPKEAATPICSYFQRQGQCAKGADCPFRHIKVNPRAVVCPSFSLLGFCQNEECLMKHVRIHKPDHNKTLTLRTNSMVVKNKKAW